MIARIITKVCHLRILSVEAQNIGCRGPCIGRVEGDAAACVIGDVKRFVCSIVGRSIACAKLYRHLCCQAVPVTVPLVRVTTVPFRRMYC